MGSGNDQQPPPDYIPGNPIHLHSSISVLSEMVWEGGPDSDWFYVFVCVCVCVRISHIQAAVAPPGCPVLDSS